jgi:SAM-dependent methyltransferase
MMMSDDARSILETHRKIWYKKPVLRDLYQTYFDKIHHACISGRTLEVGCGCGNFRELFPDTISLDVVMVPWMDVMADAHRLPFRDNSITNIVMIDVLHHLEAPAAFLRETERVLRPHGRIILVEPAITPFSKVVYSLFHEEPVNLRSDPFTDPVPDTGRRPFDANQAIPSLLFHRYRKQFTEAFPHLEIQELQYQDIFAYPLSGGFRPWSLLPYPLFRSVYTLEQRMLPVLGPFMAFRLFCVLEKNANISKDQMNILQ